MQTLYGLHINNTGQISVDVFSERRSPPNKWRVYFCVTPASAARLRRVYLAHKMSFYVSREWSPARWRVYKEWRADWITGGGGGASPRYLDSLETKIGGMAK
jgi:hypothetical protein